MDIDVDVDKIARNVVATIKNNQSDRPQALDNIIKEDSPFKKIKNLADDKTSEVIENGSKPRGWLRRLFDKSTKKAVRAVADNHSVEAEGIETYNKVQRMQNKINYEVKRHEYTMMHDANRYEENKNFLVNVMDCKEGYAPSMSWISLYKKIYNIELLIIRIISFLGKGGKLTRKLGMFLVSIGIFLLIVNVLKAVGLWQLIIDFFSSVRLER